MQPNSSKTLILSKISVIVCACRISFVNIMRQSWWLVLLNRSYKALPTTGLVYCKSKLITLSKNANLSRCLYPNRGICTIKGILFLCIRYSYNWLEFPRDSYITKPVFGRYVISGITFLLWEICFDILRWVLVLNLQINHTFQTTCASRWAMYLQTDIWHHKTQMISYILPWLIHIQSVFWSAHFKWCVNNISIFAID